MSESIRSMDSEKIEAQDVRIGKWYWYYPMDRPVCLIDIDMPAVSIPTVSLVHGGGAPPHGSGYFFQRKVEWSELGDLKVAPTPLDY